MKMFITRTGLDSKLLISGDLTQSDLPQKDQGAFKFCLEKLVNIDGIGICYLEKGDILRNKLIPIILEILDERQIYNYSRHERTR